MLVRCHPLQTGHRYGRIGWPKCLEAPMAPLMADDSSLKRRLLKHILLRDSGVIGAA